MKTATLGNSAYPGKPTITPPAPFAVKLGRFVGFAIALAFAWALVLGLVWLGLLALQAIGAVLP